MKKCSTPKDIPNLQNIRQTSDNESFLNDRLMSLNSIDGNLNESDGYNCDLCKNRGYYTKINGDELCTYDCECMNMRKNIKLFKASGIGGHTFDDFTTAESWQKNILQIVKSSIPKISSGDIWLYLGGQSGSGKTHLCTAVLNELICSYHKAPLLFDWIEDSGKLKRLVNDPQYDQVISTYKTAEILYIDDFFKVKGSNIEAITPADVKIAFDIIDYRSRKSLTTIISSEFSLDKIIDIDEATGGRIKQNVKGYGLNISKDKNKNYRLKNS